MILRVPSLILVSQLFPVYFFLPVSIFPIEQHAVKALFTQYVPQKTVFYVFTLSKNINLVLLMPIFKPCFWLFTLEPIQQILEIMRIICQYDCIIRIPLVAIYFNSKKTHSTHKFEQHRAQDGHLENTFFIKRKKLKDFNFHQVVRV